MNAWIVLALAASGSAFVLFGSFIAAAAPNDGQTGMVLFPMYAIGGVLGVVSLVGCWIGRVPWPTALAVACLLGLAIFSVRCVIGDFA